MKFTDLQEQAAAAALYLIKPLTILKRYARMNLMSLKRRGIFSGKVINTVRNITLIRNKKRAITSGFMKRR